MTRINSAIPVKNLTDEHLLAEHREIKRMVAFFKTTNNLNIPKLFCLGSGHLKFFLNKQYFLAKRYIDIYEECLTRGFNITNYIDNWSSAKSDMLKQNCWHDYEPTLDEYNLLIQRISDRIKTSTAIFHYYSKSVTKVEAIKILKQ